MKPTLPTVKVSPEFPLTDSIVKVTTAVPATGNSFGSEYTWKPKSLLPTVPWICWVNPTLTRSPLTSLQPAAPFVEIRDNCHVIMRRA